MLRLLPHNLSGRLLVAATLAIVTGTVGFAYWTSSSQARQLLKARMVQSELLSRNLAEGSARSYVIEDYAGLDYYLRHAMELAGLRRIVATDPRGTVLSHFSKQDDTASPELDAAIVEVTVPAIHVVSMQRQGEQLVVWSPVIAGGTLGWLRVNHDLSDIRSLQHRIWYQGAVLGVLELLLGLGLFALLLQRPVKTINLLSQFARDLPGSKGVQVPVDDTVAELQVLSESLNFASRELLRAEQELKELNRTLEARVEDEVAKSRDKDLLLLQQARYQTMGELLVNIAHHWRQPLNNIGARVQENAWLLSQGEIPAGEAMACAQKVMQDLKQLSHSIDGFHLLCNPPDALAEIHASEAVARAIAMVRDGYQQVGIQIALQVQSEQPIRGTLQHLVQCYLNLLGNARDAILVAGREAGLITITILVERPDILMVTVADNGCGIPEQLMDSLFDPYVTSKFRARGVGLGLFVVRQIVEQHLNGTICARNGVVGAELVMRLPVMVSER